MKNVFIIHGTYGNPEENWFPWLKKELERLNIPVFIPAFPTPEKQNIKNWTETFLPLEKKINEKSIFVGHSIGPAFVLHILERYKIKKAIFVAGFLGSLGNTDFDKLNKSFFKEFEWKTITQNCEKFVLFHADNDPYVPLNKGEELANKLGVKLKIISGAGHFNKVAGYTEFKEVLNVIKEL